MPRPRKAIQDVAFASTVHRSTEPAWYVPGATPLRVSFATAVSESRKFRPAEEAALGVLRAPGGSLSAGWMLAPWPGELPRRRRRRRGVGCEDPPSDGSGHGLVRISMRFMRFLV